jgi:hypothetical protein
MRLYPTFANDLYSRTGLSSRIKAVEADRLRLLIVRVDRRNESVDCHIWLIQFRGTVASNIYAEQSRMSEENAGLEYDVGANESFSSVVFWIDEPQVR